MLMHRGQHVEGGQRLCHVKSADGIHVRGDNRHAGPAKAGMFEGEVALQFNIGAAFQRGAFRPDKHIFET